MPKFVKAIFEDKFFTLFFEGAKDFFSLDNDLISDDVQEILKNEENRKEFLEKIEDLRMSEDDGEIIIKMETGKVTVRSL